MSPAIAHEREQSLWRSTYTTAEGWSKDDVLPDHKSAAAPALAQNGDKLLCVRRGARQGVEKNVPLLWSSRTPVDVDRPLAKATAVAGAAHRWTPDADLGNGNLAFHTPAVAAHEGSVYAVYYRFWDDGRGGLGTTCRPAGGPWKEARRHGDLPALGPGRWPGLAVYQGRLHLVFAVSGSSTDAQGPEGAIVQHATLADDGEWAPVQHGRGSARLEVVNADQEGATQAVGMRPPGNYALTEHDGLLHLLYRKEYDLRMWHATYDGDTWSKAVALDGLTSRRGASIASYDGKLHAVCPSPDNDLLCHAVYEGGTWGNGEVIAGHESRHDPALVAYVEADGSRSLFLLHRGLDSHAPHRRSSLSNRRQTSRSRRA